MSVMQVPESQPTLTRVFDGLTDAACREILAVLSEAPAPLTEGELAERVAASRAAGTDGEADPAAVESTLRHVHLPKLAQVDLVAWDRPGATVSTTDHPLHDDAQFHSLLAAEPEHWERAVTVHSDERRRATVAALDSRTGPVTREELAREVADADGDVSPSQAREVAVQLHHIHLPKLDEAGVVEYDADAGTVRRTGEATIPWMDAEVAVENES